MKLLIDNSKKVMNETKLSENH